MEESILYAKKYLEDLLSFFGLNIDVYATNDEEVIELSVPSSHMNGFLIGQHGDTVRAMQYMVSTALSNNGYAVTRVNVDVADYKKARQDRLAEQTLVWIDRVKSSQKPYELQPMNPADRRIVHKVAGEHGLSTDSIGFGRDRRVVLSFDASVKDEASEEEPAVAEKPAKSATKDEKAEVVETTEPAEKKPRIRKKPTDKAQSVDEYLEKEAAEAKKPKKGLLKRLKKDKD